MVKKSIIDSASCSAAYSDAMTFYAGMKVVIFFINLKGMQKITILCIAKLSA